MTCVTCTRTLLPEYEAIFAAILWGIEAAAYAALVKMCAFFLALTLLGRTLRWLVR